MLQHHSSRIPRRLVFVLSAGAAVSFVFLVTCVWCNDWGLRGLAREDIYEDGEHLGSPLQRRMAAYGAPGRGGPMLWLWNLVDPAGPRHECQVLPQFLLVIAGIHYSVYGMLCFAAPAHAVA